MTNIEIILTIISLIVLIVAGFYAVFKKDLIHAVVATSVISLVLSLMFYLLQAPDVALTEAAIGIALSTIIFIITIRNTKRFEDK
ncbi:MAG: DUF4040 domain-containing protein [Chlorobi bacterium]|nr:DUF4040 domain-containing protein [Chlorobiota bacterium]